MNTLREAAQAAPDAEVRAQHKEFARWFLELGDKSALASEYLAWLAWKAALAHPPRNEWREAAEEALRWMEHARLHLTIKERMHPDGLSLYDSAAEALRAALAKPETDAGVSWDGHNVRGDADSIAEVRRLIDFEQARQGAKPATGDDLRVYDAIAANYVNAEPEPVVIGPEWTPCVKLPVTVHVREQRPGEQHVSTREGITPVKPDDLIMRGVAGEEYPIGRELFGRTYRIGANPPRDEWRPASEPPEDLRRRVIAWRSPPQRQSGTWVEALYDDGAWVTRDGIAHDITHWRDVTPPMESPIAAKCQRVEGSGEICGLTPPCPDCGSSLIDVPEGA